MSLTKEDIKTIKGIVKETEGRMYNAIDKLAAITAKNFARIETKMATKEDLVDLEERMNFRYNRRLELLEDDVRILKNKLA